MDEGELRRACLARARFAAELAARLEDVGEAAGNAAMAEGEEPAMGIERPSPVPPEDAVARQCRGLAARRKSQFLEEDHEGDGEGIIDGEEIDILAARSRFLKRALAAFGKAEV